jgi:F-type H+-transporting ATPase subunit a
MSGAPLLLALLLQAAPAPGEAHPPPTHEAAPAHERVEETGADVHAAEGGEHVDESGLATVIMHHVTDQTFFGFPSRHLVFFVLAALLVVLGSRLAIRSYRGGVVPRGLAGAVEALVLFVRDEIAEPSIGHGEGRQYTPLLCSFFFFILVAALLGLVPVPAYDHGRWSLAGTTSTGNIAVTMALAGISFLAQQHAGISRYGVVGHFRNLVPEGLPLWLLPIMIPVEIISMFTKPFALMIRLFANMLAGHMVITTLLLLIALMGQISWVSGVLMTPVSLALGLFIMLLEILVAFIQAYIFTMLSALFIGMYAHPAH